MRATPLPIAALLVVLVVLFGCASADVGEDECFIGGRPKLKEQPPVTDAQMQWALDTWRRYDMPEPQADAQPVIWTEPGRTRVRGKELPPWRGIGFLVHPGTDENPPVVFTSVQEVELTRRNAAVPCSPLDPGDLDEDDLESIRTFSVYEQFFLPYNYSHNFAVALHLWARGHKQLGRALARTQVGLRYDTVRDAVEQPDNDTFENVVGAVVWGYWFNQAFRPGTDRAAIYARLMRATGEFECLDPKDEEIARRNVPLLQQLASVFDPARPASDGPAALVDEMVEVSLQVYDGLLSWGWPFKQDLPPCLISLIRLGFDAVPTLIAHLGDQRLTRTISTPTFNGRPAPVTVGQMAHMVLECLSNGQCGPARVWDRDSMLWRVDTSASEQWWANVRDQDESDHFRKIAALSQSERHAISWNLHSQEAAVLVLGQKYPEALEQAYLEVADTRLSAVIEEMGMEIALGKLPTQRKVDLLSECAGSSISYHERAAMIALQTVDESAYCKLLIRKMHEHDGTYEWFYPYSGAAANYTQLVQRVDDPAAWEALDLWARRGTPALRMRIVAQFRSDNMRDRHTWLSFVARFLNDNDVRHTKDDPTHSGCDDLARLGTIPIKDFVVRRLATMLGVTKSAEIDIDPRNLALLRSKVTRALEAEGITPG